VDGAVSDAVGPAAERSDEHPELSAVFNYATEAEQIAAFKDYTDSGYTHDVLGPWVPNNDCGYHGEWPCRQDTFDQWLDQHQFYWDRGVTPVVFIKPDNWTLAQL
jgi:hypothetical protein